MRVTTYNGCLTYHENGYSLEIYPEGDAYLRHPCPKSSEGDGDHYDHILPHELKDNKCRYCTELNIPESLQTLFYLYRYGRPDKVSY